MLVKKELMILLNLLMKILLNKNYELLLIIINSLSLYNRFI